jgi:putative ABC transport system substrate-binding protein
MRRREVFTLLGGAMAWPRISHAQQPATPVIGFLGPGSALSDAFRVTAFRQGLSETGFVEGQNLRVDYRWAENHHNRLPAMAADLVYRQVAVIVATSVSAVLAAKAATTTIPIVFEMAADPVRRGIVASLNQPGGNITGVTRMGEEILAKRLELLHELLPKARVMALLVNPADPDLAEPEAQVVLSAAKTFGLEVEVLHAVTDRDFEVVFARLTELQTQGLIVGGDPLFNDLIDQLAALTVQHAVPAIYQRREFVAAGGLMSYGSDIADAHRLAGLYTGRILKGEKPADLPVQQETKAELYINLKTAKALGITIPRSLVTRADEMIE